jgi:hypothetical protein
MFDGVVFEGTAYMGIYLATRVREGLQERASLEVI